MQAATTAPGMMLVWWLMLPVTVFHMSQIAMQGDDDAHYNKGDESIWFQW
jgi:hypothetical protein